MPIHDVVRQRLQPFTSAVTSNRILLYSVFGTAALVGTVANACRTYSNFYSVTIYLSRSSRSVLVRSRSCLLRSRPGIGNLFTQVLANFGLLVGLLCGRVMQRLFFGPLQPREVEVRTAS